MERGLMHFAAQSFLLDSVRILRIGNFEEQIKKQAYSIDQHMFDRIFFLDYGSEFETGRSGAGCISDYFLQVLRRRISDASAGVCGDEAAQTQAYTFRFRIFQPFRFRMCSDVDACVPIRSHICKRFNRIGAHMHQSDFYNVVCNPF